MSIAENYPLVAVSNGWGVQSMCTLTMVAFGDLPPIDAALHADTLHERSATYAYAAKWTPWLLKHGINVVTLPNATGGIWEIFKRPGQTHIPAFTKYTGEPITVPEKKWMWDEDGDEYEVPTGRMVVVDPRRDGQLNRSCTQRWKIVTMRRWLQKYRRVEDWEGNLLSVRPVEQWLNISMDEWQRAKDSDVKYITNRFPLIERRMTRNDCINYLERHGIEVPPKSSCTFCPFHNRAAWREMKAEDGADWREAVAVDEALRTVRPPFDLFLHTDRIPLTEVDLRTPTDHGQLDFWQQTCDSGYCWT
jgi:hypothetical protein